MSRRNSRTVRGILLGTLLVVLSLHISCGGPAGRMIGAIQTTCAEDVAVSGQYAYVADGPGGLLVIDISNPLQPTLQRAIATTYAFRVAVRDNCLYLCDGPDGLRVYTLENPVELRQTFQFVTQWACGMTFTEGYLYLADYYDGFLIFDVANPQEPSISSFGKVGTTRGISAENRILATTDLTDGLSAFIIDSPLAPDEVYTETGSPGNYGDIVCHNGRAVVARNDDASCIQVYDVSSPADIRMQQAINPATFVEGLTLSGDTLLIACGEQGVMGFDLHDPSGFKYLWTVPTSGYARRAVALGKFLYVAQMSGLGIYDISRMEGNRR